MKIGQLFEGQQEVPDGKYFGKQSGYRVTVTKYPSSSFELKTGLRGMNIPVTVIITNGIPDVSVQKYNDATDRYCPYDWNNKQWLNPEDFQ